MTQSGELEERPDSSIEQTIFWRQIYLPVLTAQAHRFRERRGFWSQRITELDDRSLVAP